MDIILPLVKIMVIIAASGVGAYISSFFKQTARINADNANSEKIEHLTKTVEGVKSEFEKNNEILRNSLDLKKQHKMSLKKLEIDAYLEYNKVVSSWLSGMADFSIGGYSLENHEDLRSNFDQQFSKSNLEEATAFASLHFFEHDPDFYSTIIRDLKIGLIEFRSILSRAIFAVEREFSAAKFDFSQIDKEGPDLTGKYENQKVRREQMYSKLTEIGEQYNKDMLNQYRDVYAKYRKFTNYAKGKIDQLNEF